MSLRSRFSVTSVFQSSASCQQKVRKTRQAKFLMESLEDRAVPAVITWDGGAGSNNFWDKANWSTDTVPGKNDDVVVPAFSGNARLVIDGTCELRSIQTKAPLQLTTTTNDSYRCRLILDGGNSLIDNGIYLDTANLKDLRIQASGAGTVVTVNGNLGNPGAILKEFSASAFAGAQMSFTNTVLPTYVNASFEASDLGSRMLVQGIKHFDHIGNPTINVMKDAEMTFADLERMDLVNRTYNGWFHVIVVSEGGKLNLPALKSLTTGTEHEGSPNLSLYTSDLKNSDGSFQYSKSILNTPELQTLKNVSVSVYQMANSCIWNAPKLESFSKCSLGYNAPGQLMVLPSVKEIHETNFFVHQGFVELPNVGVVDLGQMRWNTTWVSNGKGSALTITAKEVRGQLGRGNFFYINALNDGLINLNSNSLIDDNASKDDGGLFAKAKDNGILRLNVNQTAGTIIDLPESGILAMDSVIDARFKVLRGWDSTQGRFYAQKMQSFKIDTYIGSDYTVIKNSPRFGPNLDEYHSSNPLRLEKIDAPNVTRVEGDFSASTNPFPKLREFYGRLKLDTGDSAQSIFSTPAMPGTAISKITSVHFDGKRSWPELFNAKQLEGVHLSFENIAGTVEFTGVESITNQLSIYLSDQTGVTLIFPKLTSFIDSSITTEYGVSTIEVPVLRDASRSNLVFASDNNSWANAKGGKTWFVAPNLSCIDGTRFSIRRGNQITLPAVTDVILPSDNGNIPAWDIQGRTNGGFSWSGPYPTDHVQLDDPSKLSLPNLKSIKFGVSGASNTTTSTISVQDRSAIEFNQTGTLLEGSVSLSQASSSIISGNITIGTLATYSGNGQIQGSLTNQGTINLIGDNSNYGNLSISGSFTQTTTGKTNLELGAANKTDSISANSSLVIDGQLNISLIDDFANSSLVPSATVQVLSGSPISYKSSKTLFVKQPGTNGNSVQIAFQPNGQAILSKPTSTPAPTPTPTPLPASPGNISWDGGAGTNRWGDAANWSGDRLPGSGSIVTIPAQAALNEILIDQNVEIARLTTSEPLRVEAKSTTTPVMVRVNSGASVINQGVVLKGGTLATQNSGTTLDIYGQTKLEAVALSSTNTAPTQAGLQAINGSWLTVHDTKTIVAGLNDLTVTAIGGGAKVMFPDLLAAHTQTTVSGSVKSAIHLSASGGGAIEMPKLKSMSGDKINIVIQNSWINTPLLTGLKNATIMITDTTDNGVQQADWINTELGFLDRSSFFVTGADITLSLLKVKSITQTNLSATGSKLYFPAIDKVDFNLFYLTGDNPVRSWTATGAGSLLEVRANSISGNINSGSTFIAQASQKALLSIYSPTISDQRLVPASTGGLYLKADTGGILRAYNTATSGTIVDVASGGAVAMDQAVQGQFKQIRTADGRFYASAMTSLTITDPDASVVTPMDMIVAPKVTSINGRFQAYSNPFPVLSTISGSLKLLHQKGTPVSQVTIFNTPAATALSGFTVTMEQGVSWPQLLSQQSWSNLTVNQIQTDGTVKVVTKSTAALIPASSSTVKPASVTVNKAVTAKPIPKPKVVAVKKTPAVPTKKAVPKVTVKKKF